MDLLQIFCVVVDKVKCTRNVQQDKFTTTPRTSLQQIHNISTFPKQVLQQIHNNYINTQQVYNKLYNKSTTNRDGVWAKVKVAEKSSLYYRLITANGLN